MSAAAALIAEWESRYDAAKVTFDALYERRRDTMPEMRDERDEVLFHSLVGSLSSLRACITDLAASGEVTT